MTTWFRLENNVAVEATDVDPEGRFRAELVWVPSTSVDDRVGDIYNGTAFSHAVEVPPVPVVPGEVSIMQGQLALLATASPTRAGKTLLDDVNDAVAASNDPRVKIAWNKATILERRGLFVTQIAPTIPGLDTDAALDALFTAASQIVV